MLLAGRPTARRVLGGQLTALRVQYDRQRRLHPGDVESLLAYLEPEVEDLDALADAASGVPELAGAQSG
jgi:hypothetical protein